MHRTRHIPWAAKWHASHHIRALSAHSVYALDVVDFSVVDLRHASDSPRSVFWIGVRVSPAVDCALDKSTLAAKTRVELCKSPSDGVAVGLVGESVATVCALLAAGSWVDAVLVLELGAQLVDVDGLDVAADGILHLDAVARVLEGDPLNSVVILSNYEWRSRWNWSWVRAWTDTCPSNVVRGSIWRRRVHNLLVVVLWWCLSLRNWCGSLLKLWWDILLLRSSWRTRHLLLVWVLHLVLAGLMRHQ